VGRLRPTSTWECFWKTGALSGNLGLPRAAVVGCRADVFPTTVSAESFEETDTARTPRIREEAWPAGGWCRRVVGISRYQVLIMSWFEPLAGITSDHQGSSQAPQQTEGPGGALGSRTAGGMLGPWSPAIRERACPGPGLNLGSDP
jgi:hypothetical protein